MIKLRMPSGHYAYSASAVSTFYLGGRGICDRCNDFAPNGYMVPLHTSYYCSDCFRAVKVRTKFYPDSVPFEQMVMENWERRVPVLIDVAASN